MTYKPEDGEEGGWALGSSWRDRPPTHKQRDYLNRYGLPIPEKCGDANHVIYEHWLKRQAEKK